MGIGGYGKHGSMPTRRQPLPIPQGSINWILVPSFVSVIWVIGVLGTRRLGDPYEASCSVSVLTQVPYLAPRARPPWAQNKVTNEIKNKVTSRRIRGIRLEKREEYWGTMGTARAALLRSFWLAFLAFPTVY